MNKEENLHGGRRNGAGRKKTGRNKILSICGTEEELKNIKLNAALKGKSISRFVIEKVLGK